MFSKFNFVRISEAFSWNNSELSSFRRQCYLVVLRMKSNFEKTLQKLRDTSLFFYLEKSQLATSSTI